MRDPYEDTYADPEFIAFRDALRPLPKAPPRAPRQAIPEKPSALRRIPDVGVAALKGIVSIGEMGAGFANIPTGGYAGRALERSGVNLKGTQEYLESLYSPQQQAANKVVQDTKGFLPTVGAHLRNPSTIATGLVEALGPIGVGRKIAQKSLGAVGKYVGDKAAPYVAGAVGEGAVGLGLASERMRQETEDGLQTPKQALASVGSGLGTAAFGALGGRFSASRGVGDIDVPGALTSAAGQGAQKGFLRRMTEAGISEGVFEETPQSMQETMWQNYGLGKPLMDGVPEAAGSGLVLGTAMGAGVGAVSGRPRDLTKPAGQPGTTPAGAVDPAVDPWVTEFEASENQYDQAWRDAHSASQPAVGEGWSPAAIEEMRLAQAQVDAEWGETAEGRAAAAASLTPERVPVTQAPVKPPKTSQVHKELVTQLEARLVTEEITQEQADLLLDSATDYKSARAASAALKKLLVENKQAAEPDGDALNAFAAEIGVSVAGEKMRGLTRRLMALNDAEIDVETVVSIASLLAENKTGKAEAELTKAENPAPQAAVTGEVEQAPQGAAPEVDAAVEKFAADALASPAGHKIDTSDKKTQGYITRFLALPEQAQINHGPSITALMASPGNNRKISDGLGKLEKRYAVETFTPGAPVSTMAIPEMPVDATQTTEYLDQLKEYMIDGVDPEGLALYQLSIGGGDHVAERTRESLRTIADTLKISHAEVDNRIKAAKQDLLSNAHAAGINPQRYLELLGVQVETIYDAPDSGFEGGTRVPVSDDFDPTAGFERTESADEAAVQGAEDKSFAAEVDNEVDNKPDAQDTTEEFEDQREAASDEFPSPREIAESVFGAAFTDMSRSTQHDFMDDVAAAVIESGRNHGALVGLVQQLEGKYNEIIIRKNAQAAQRGAEGLQQEPGEVARVPGQDGAAKKPAQVTVRKTRKVEAPKATTEAKAATPKQSVTTTKSSGNTVAKIQAVLNKAFATPRAMEKVVTIVQATVDLPAGDVRSSFEVGTGVVQGVFYQDRVWLVADNITPGQEMSVLLHELGVHGGMIDLIGLRKFEGLVKQIKVWEKSGTGREGKLAKVAMARVGQAEKSSGAMDETLADEELVAYFVEEAVNSGIDPTAVKTSDGPIEAFLVALLDALIAGLRKMGLGRFDTLNAQNIVDLAYGAARIKMNQGGAGDKVGEVKQSVADDKGPDTKESEYKTPKAYLAARARILEKGYTYVENSLRHGPGTTMFATFKKPEPKQPAARKGAADFQKLKDIVAPKQSVASEYVETVAGKTGRKFVDDSRHLLGKAIKKMMFLYDLQKLARKTLPSAGIWYDAFQKSVATRNDMELKADAIVVLADTLSQESYDRVNEFIAESTFEQKWGFKPEWKTGVVVDTGQAAKWGELSPAEQAVVEAVFKHGEDSIQRKQAILTKLGVADLLGNFGKLRGPYAPLKRFGNYIAVLKSKELDVAEREYAKAPTVKLKDQIDRLKRNDTHFVSSSFTTMGQAKQFQRENAKDWHFSDAFEKSTNVDDRATMDSAVLQRVMSAIKADAGLPENVRKEMEETVKSLYLAALEDTNARQSGAKRKFRAGYDRDMLRAFFSGSRADAIYTANMEHGGEINDAFYKMQREARNPETGTRDGQDMFNVLAEHYAENAKYSDTWTDRAQAAVVGVTSAWQLSTSLGYHVTNATQGMMVTVPKIAGEFNDYTGAWGALMDGYRLMADIYDGMGVDLTKIRNAPLREALESAARQGILDIGIEEDLGSFNRSRTGYVALDGASKLGSTIMHKLRSVSRMVETWNRVSSGYAAYTMAKKHGRTEAEAVAYVEEVLQNTQGDFTRPGAPMLLKSLPRVTVQYRKFQFMMAAFYVKAYVSAFHGATAEEKAVGKRVLAYKLFHTTMAAGVMGMPLISIAAMAFSAMGDDDEPKDLEASLRDAIGDEEIANLLLRGPLAMLGLDMSSKVGDDKIFSIAPFTDFEIDNAAGLSKTLTGLVGGPSMSQAGKTADGIGLMGDGEMYKGLEKLLPKGFSTAMASFRMANEGYTLKNGDMVIKPEDLSAVALAFNSVGLPTSQFQNIQRNRSLQFEIKKFYADRSSDIRTAYIKAYRNKDTGTMREMREEWASLQAGKRNQMMYFPEGSKALKAQPLSVLIRSPHAAAKRERVGQKDYDFEDED